MSRLILVYITSKDCIEANIIAKNLLDNKFVACVNIIDNASSLYLWNGALCNEKEVVLVAKTKEVLLQQIIDAVKLLHSYDMPCVIALPIIGGNIEFLEWIKNETIS